MGGKKRPMPGGVPLVAVKQSASASSQSKAGWRARAYASRATGKSSPPFSATDSARNAARRGNHRHGLSFHFSSPSAASKPGFTCGCKRHGSERLPGSDAKKWQESTAEGNGCVEVSTGIPVADCLLGCSRPASAWAGKPTSKPELKIAVKTWLKAMLATNHGAPHAGKRGRRTSVSRVPRTYCQTLPMKSGVFVGGFNWCRKPRWPWRQRWSSGCRPVTGTNTAGDQGV